MTEGRKQFVLIVDDQPNWRELFHELLLGEYEVASASSYSEAMETLLAQDPPFHVAVVDIRLTEEIPGDNQGLELVQRLNEFGNYTNTIIVTGYPTIQTVKRSLRDLAAFEFLEKYPEDGDGFDYLSFRKIVRRAAADAEDRRPRSFVRKGSRVVVLERNLEWQKLLVNILRADGYDVQGVESEADLIQVVKAQSCGLLIINSDFFMSETSGHELVSRIRKHEPDARIIMLTREDIDEIAQVLRTREILEVVPIVHDCLDEQRFRETVRRAFSLEATKYVSASLSLPEGVDFLELGRDYTLVLSIQDRRVGDCVSVWLAPRGSRQSSTILTMSVDAPKLQIKGGRRAYWPLPPRRDPPQLKIELTPLEVGQTTLMIDIEDGPNLLGRLEKKLEVVDVSGNKDKEISKS